MRYRDDTGRGVNASGVARTGLLLALAAILGLAETLWLPAMPVPGMRLGLANVAVVLALATLGCREAAIVSIGRVAIVGLATGSLFGPVGVMSATAALSSWIVMSAMHLCRGTFSPVGWSVAGSAASVCAQLAIACAITGTAAPLALAPLSLALSLPSGLAVGLLAGVLVSRVSRLSVQVVG